MATRLLDVNVLIALTQAGHVHFDAAHRWLAKLLETEDRWATSPITEASYLRLATNPAVVGQAITLPEALESLNALRSPTGHRFLADMTSLSYTQLDLAALVGSKQVTDFHLVNLAASSDAVLATFDRRLVDALTPSDRRFVELIPV